MTTESQPPVVLVICLVVLVVEVYGPLGHDPQADEGKPIIVFFFFVTS